MFILILCFAFDKIQSLDSRKILGDNLSVSRLYFSLLGNLSASLSPHPGRQTLPGLLRPSLRLGDRLPGAPRPQHRLNLILAVSNNNKILKNTFTVLSPD